MKYEHRLNVSPLLLILIACNHMSQDGIAEVSQAS